MLDLSSVGRDEHLLGVFAVMLGAGLVASRLAARLRVPDLVAFLVLGALLGPHAAGVLDVPAGSPVESIALTFGASYILFEGGLDVRLPLLREIGFTVGMLATVGVLITAGAVAGAGHLFLGMTWFQALLLGSCVAATDPAALIPLFKQIRIRERVAQTVICEAAFNDAVSAVLTFALLAAATGGGAISGMTVATQFALQAGIGLLVGALLGFGAALAVGHSRYGFLRAHATLVMLFTVMAAYAGAGLLGGSGFMAVFVAGIVVGNRESFGFQLSENAARHLHEYTETTSLVLRMLMFMLVGAKLDFGPLAGQWLGAAACIACLIVVARPLAVLACALPDRKVKWSAREILFMCWTRETGVIPAALAGMLLTSGIAGAQEIAAVIFGAIVVTLVLQGGTTRWVARGLGLHHPGA